MYRFNDNLIKNTFSNLTQKYTLNETYDDTYEIEGFVTNATLSPNSSYHLHSLELFNRGDILTYKDKYYMVTGDVIVDRISKYKATFDYCNWSQSFKTVEQQVIGIDDWGRPIIDDVEVDGGTDYGVVRYKDISVSDNNEINQVTPMYTLTVRDMEANRERYKVNGKIDIEGKQFTIYNIVHIKRGLLELRLQ